ncbi:protein toll-like [Zophobas morio]|uniref:protein toll-like n=1 Tax=Zophobas morio TaxID=2755281 RepID=UPI0030835D6C
MTIPLWSFLFLFSVFSSAFGELTCNSKDACKCYSSPTDFEIQCPPGDDFDLIVHVTQANTEISVDCATELKILHPYQLPNITMEYVEVFRMRSCPWPQKPFHTIIKTFSPRKVTSLNFIDSSGTKHVLTADYFQNLESLQHLNLNENRLTNLDEDVFKNMPNLLNLELEDNNIVLKKKMFRYVPQLEFLYLSGNGLENLPDGVFKPLKMLERLHLWNNKLKSLDRSTFRGLVSLQSLELSINQIESIAEDAFKDLKNLIQVNLSSNKLKMIPSSLFRYNRKLESLRMKNNFNLQLPDYLFANSTIKDVDLSNCRLQTIPEHIFENCANLSTIILENNHLKYLSQVLFKGLVNLKKINLQKNSISALASDVFSDLSALENLNLKANKLEHVYSKLFTNLTELRIVDFSRNRIITPIEEIIALEETPHLTQLDLRHNYISSIKLRYLKPRANITIRLNYNRITIVDFQDVDFKTTSAISQIYLNNNPIECCNNYDLVVFMKSSRKQSSIDIFPKKLTCLNSQESKNQTTVINVSANFTCSLGIFQKNFHCPDACTCSWKLLDKSVVIDCSYRKLTDFPIIDLTQNDRVEINLEGNYLSQVPELSAFHNVTKLFLAHNKIRKVLSVPPNLEVLELNHNHLNTLDPHIVSKLNSTRLLRLTLHDNPWVCDCNSASLANFLRQSNAVVTNDIACLNNKQRLVNLKKSDLCDNGKTMYLLSVVLVVLLIFAAGTACYYRYQQQIKIWLFSKNLCLWWVTEEDLDKNKTYDAFISYSHGDEQFVTENLLPTLEKSPQGYKLCVHYRNWIPGELITSQITNSVFQSKRTVVVLSENFLESVWGKMEFRTAHTHAMSEGRTRVIIVLYGDVDINSLDEELKMYLKTNTYVKWGDPYFWDKLKYALPHKKVQVGNKVRVNEEVTLIQSAPSSPGTTPPINLSPNLEKRNPFKFVQRMDGSKFSSLG